MVTLRPVSHSELLLPLHFQSANTPGNLAFLSLCERASLTAAVQGGRVLHPESSVRIVRNIAN